MPKYSPQPAKMRKKGVAAAVQRSAPKGSRRKKVPGYNPYECPRRIYRSLNRSISTRLPAKTKDRKGWSAGVAADAETHSIGPDRSLTPGRCRNDKMLGRGWSFEDPPPEIARRSWLFVVKGADVPVHRNLSAVYG